MGSRGGGENTRYLLVAFNDPITIMEHVAGDVADGVDKTSPIAHHGDGRGVSGLACEVDDEKTNAEKD